MNSTLAVSFFQADVAGGRTRQLQAARFTPKPALAGARIDAFERLRTSTATATAGDLFSR